jgi:uncharacterized membrane protein
MRVGRGRAGQEAYIRYLVLGIGGLVVLVSVLADVLGIGGEPGFGYKQDVGVLVGAAIIIAGVRWRPRR